MTLHIQPYRPYSDAALGRGTVYQALFRIKRRLAARALTDTSVCDVWTMMMKGHVVLVAPVTHPRDPIAQDLDGIAPRRALGGALPAVLDYPHLCYHKPRLKCP
jgi:hypothetical protein